MRQNEQSWILTGGHHKRLWWGYTSHESEGHPGAVGFPYQWVLDREEKVGDIVGFKHTHPGFLASPSLRDDATMQQWVLSFGKPLICLIEGINGLKGYLYYSDEQPPIPIRTLKTFGQLIVGIMPKKPLSAYNLATPESVGEILSEIEAKPDRLSDERERDIMRVNGGRAIDWDEKIRNF